MGLLACSAVAVLAQDAVAELKPCWLKGVEHQARCGKVVRPLDPEQPQARQIEVHFAVLPALARRKADDPVFFFAGGPGQSAIDLAGPLSQRYKRFSNRRDLVFIDQRGTGRSAPLKCPDDTDRLALQPLAVALDEPRRQQRVLDCLVQLQALPHGDLRQYTTTIAMGDVDAVREALRVERINAIGASYGTRAVLEYQRQFAQRVRRAILDGVAPPDMVLPESFSPDNQAVLDAMWSACEAEDACNRRYPDLRGRWHRLLARLPLRAEVAHPVTGEVEVLTITRTWVLGAVRAPLYAPALAAALPAAVAEAEQGRFGGLLGLSQALGMSGGALASGMHFSVVCAEDGPRMAADANAPQAAAGAASAAGKPPSADFGTTFAQVYREVCARWPRGAVPAAFYRISQADSAVLIFSGGLDPVTPPRHGARVAAALGAKARHVIVPNVGHGVLAAACLRDAAVRFVDAADDDEALKVSADCADALPRPLAFMPLQTSDAASGVAR